jgi:hypothetical protein
LLTLLQCRKGVSETASRDTTVVNASLPGPIRSVRDIATPDYAAGDQKRSEADADYLAYGEKRDVNVPDYLAYGEKRSEADADYLAYGEKRDVNVPDYVAYGEKA